MRLFLVSLILLLAACGGGGGTLVAVPLPEAQAATIDGCPTGDATAQVQALIDGGHAVLPPCVFNVTTLRVSKPTNIHCAGSDVDGTVIHYTADEGLVVDPTVVVNIPTGGWNKRGFWFKMTDCRIEPATKGGGKHDVVWRVRPGFFISSSHMSGNHLGGAGAQGLFLDNVECNPDGIFTSTFSGNFIENGVLVKCGGDSLQFIDNIVPQGANAPGLPGYDLSFVPGAAESSIVRGNITGSGGCIVVRNATGLVLDHVWCESAGVLSGQTALITLANCRECSVIRTRIQTLGGAAPYALALDGSTLVDLDSNKLNAGTQGHISLNNSTAKLAGLNRFDGGTVGKITGASTGLLP